MVKVGDKVRCIEEYTWCTVGREYSVVDTDGKTYMVHDDDGDPTWLYEADQSCFEPVNEPAELIALRAWKASAIARFPALEQPETDEEAAERFADEYRNGYDDVETIITRAFAWARANNR